ncbi:MAG: hypothetical protein RLZZ432_697 [Chloroflexota bacterium]|jgi:DNA polymerase
MSSAREAAAGAVASTLAAIAGEIAACRACDLAAGRTMTVPGAGSPAARLVLVGEAPGAGEDAAGVPFVGASGRLLDRLLEQAGLHRAEAFVLNSVKCRPPENRDPRPAELAACRPFLARQLAVLRPVVVATLGRHALNVFAQTAQIARTHGAPYVGETELLPPGTVLFPLYHPAATIYDRRLRPLLEQDLAALAALLERGAR